MATAGNSETRSAKKLSIIYILKILRNWSDEDHPLSQQNILEKLKEEYGMTIDRKAVKRNLVNLQKAGYPVNSRETNRLTKGRQETLNLGWYYEHDFTKCELRYLIDTLYFTHIPTNQIKALANKLMKLQSRYFQFGRRFIRNLPVRGKRLEDKQLFYTIDCIEDAIGRKKKIRFFYDHYEIDKKRHHAQYSAGVDKIYTVSPYAFLAANGRYYLVCNTDGHDNVAHYRMDRISEVQVMENEPARPQKTVHGLEKGLQLPRHLAEHPYMFAGEPEECVFRVDLRLVTQVMEDFGNGVRFTAADAGHADVQTKVNPRALIIWAKQYAPYVKVLSPPSLVRELRKTAEDFHDLYNGNA